MASETFTIDLPRNLAEKVHAKVAAGEYANESEVFRDGLESLWEDKAPLPFGLVWDAWVRDELLPSLEECRANPSGLIPAAEVRAHFARRASEA